MLSENELRKMPESDVTCVRCDTHLREVGELRFQVGGIPPLLSNHGMQHAPMQTYVCPKCGKVEFFL